jgi:hypothetical protein
VIKCCATCVHWDRHRPPKNTLLGECLASCPEWVLGGDSETCDDDGKMCFSYEAMYGKTNRS